MHCHDTTFRSIINNIPRTEKKTHKIPFVLLIVLDPWKFNGKHINFKHSRCCCFCCISLHIECDCDCERTTNKPRKTEKQKTKKLWKMKLYREEREKKNVGENSNAIFAWQTWQKVLHSWVKEKDENPARALTVCWLFICSVIACACATTPYPLSLSLPRSFNGVHIIARCHSVLGLYGNIRVFRALISSLKNIPTWTNQVMRRWYFFPFLSLFNTRLPIYYCRCCISMVPSLILRCCELCVFFIRRSQSLSLSLA